MATEAPRGDVIVKINEARKYSPNPELRKQYWLDTARNSIGKVLGDLRRRATTVPQECGELLQRGGNYEAHEYPLTIAMLPDYQERAAALLAEVGDIVHEKGFVHSPALDTPREHEQMGSSGYGGIFFETDPDIPVPLLHDRLVAEGKLERIYNYSFTVDQLDRARRLEGMTTLDLATGRVTDEKDEAAAHDSYHFLAPGRRAEVIAREQAIVQELAELASLGVVRYEPATGIVDVIAEYMDGRVTSPQMQELYEGLVMSKGDLIDLAPVIKEAKQLAFGTGKWDHILTPQEILLRIKTKTKVPKQYLAHPYTPLAIQDGVSAEEVARLRQGEQSMVVTSNMSGYEMPWGFRLEELDEQGNTIQSPTILDRNKLAPIEDDHFKTSFASIVVPFARPADWYYKRGYESKVE